MTDTTKSEAREWKLEEYREYCDLSHRKYALRNGLKPDEEVRYHKLSLHFEMLDNRQLVFDAYDTLKSKHERVLQMLEIANKALSKIASVEGASCLEWSEDCYLCVADDALAQIQELKK